MKTKIIKRMKMKKDRSNTKMRMIIKSKRILQNGQESITITNINRFHRFYRKELKIRNIQKKDNKNKQ